MISALLSIIWATTPARAQIPPSWDTDCPLTAPEGLDKQWECFSLKEGGEQNITLGSISDEQDPSRYAFKCRSNYNRKMDYDEKKKACSMAFTEFAKALHQGDKRVLSRDLFAGPYVGFFRAPWYMSQKWILWATGIKAKLDKIETQGVVFNWLPKRIIDFLTSIFPKLSKFVIAFFSCVM